MNRRTLNASFALTLVALLAAACTDSPVGPTTGPSTGTDSGPGGATDTHAAAVGTYQLAAVDGSAVPTVFDSFSPGPGVLMEMRAISGQIVLRSDGSYHQEFETSLSGRGTTAGLSTVTAVEGRYRFDSNALTFTPQTGMAFHPAYTFGQIDITTSAPGLNGEIDLVTFTFRR